MGQEICLTNVKWTRGSSVENRLLDLYGVEFGEVLEADTLLKPVMRAYCGSNRDKVEQFMQEISYYAYTGSMVHFAFKGLECREHGGGERNCDNELQKEKCMANLYRFLRKASC